MFLLQNALSPNTCGDRIAAAHANELAFKVFSRGHQSIFRCYDGFVMKVADQKYRQFSDRHPIGSNFDDNKRYIDALDLSDANRVKIYEGNARRVYPRLDAVLNARGK